MSARKTAVFVGASVVLFAVLIAHARHYMPFLWDDALISLRYASRFLEGNGLTWTDGHPVEGYSNLLWILMASLLGAFRVDLIEAVRILGVLGMGSVGVSALWWYIGRGHKTGIGLSLIVGLGFFALAGPIAVWTIGGMEQPLLAALIGVAIPLAWTVMTSETVPGKTLMLLSLVLGLLCITRPDGAIFTAATTVAMFTGGRMSSRRPSYGVYLRLLSFPFLFVAGQLAFRLLFYGEMVPNTALAKIAPSIHHIAEGSKYVAGGLWALFPLSALAVVSMIASVFSREKKVQSLLLLTITVMWTAYVVFIGGEVFPAYRHFVPLIVVFTFALIEGVASVTATMRKLWPKRGAALACASAVVLFAPYVYVQFTHEENKRALSEQWAWDGEVLGLLLKSAFSEEQPLVAVTAAGCVPYWSELPALDMLGLNDYYLPRHRPAEVGKGPVGHELGDGTYVMSREPDIICFHVGSSKALFRSGIELQQMPHFHDAYAPVLVEGKHPREHRGVLWFRKYSDKIGIGVTDSTITVPAFLLNLGRGTWARLGAEGSLVISVQAGQPAEGVIEGIGDTDWDVTIEGQSPGLIQARLELRKDGVLVTLFTASSTPVDIERLVLKRKAGGTTPRTL